VVKDEVILSSSLITLLLHYIISVGTILMGESSEKVRWYGRIVRMELVWDWRQWKGMEPSKEEQWWVKCTGGMEV